MANSCFTEYIIRGDEQEIKALHETIIELEKSPAPYVANGWGNLYAGCLVEKLGGSHNNVCCRGEITSYELNDNGKELYLCTESAWSELDEVRAFISQKFPSLKFIFASEESGCSYYVTNDTECEFFGHYKLETIGVDGCSDEQHYLNNSDEVLEELQTITGIGFGSIEEALEYIEDFNSEDESKQITLSIFDIVT
ncbi:MAG: hypothetical protein IKW46_01815 [Bacteroidaceae bacterium]|nr:hypothetical protein [Bacteroidaceae bacterium]